MISTNILNPFFWKATSYRIFKRIGFIDENRLFIKPSVVNAKINNVINLSLLKKINRHDTNLDYLWNQYYKKRMFNVLGTGWKKWTYEAISKEWNCTEQFRSKYNTDIAWCLDIKSGYCFNQKKYFSRIFSEIPQGVDIKIPWEFCRMYHLPQISLLACLSEDYRDDIIREYIYEINDFSKIPVGEGILYGCAMEVAIRAVNLCLSFDILNQIDENRLFSESFKDKMFRLLWAHYNAIVCNIEADFIDDKNGNHYIADLCGIITLAVYLGIDKSDKLVSRAIDALFKEIDKQFLTSGANFECSTMYHRLATEMVSFSVIMISKMKIEVPDDIYRKLVLMRDFLRNCTKPNGELLQIGDNDSGRLININPKGKLVNIGNSVIFEENQLLPDATVAVLDSLLGIETFGDKATYTLCNAICSKHAPISKGVETMGKEGLVFLTSIPLCCEEWLFSSREEILLPQGVHTNGLERYVYSQFGLIILKNDTLFWAIRSVPNYARMRTGHAHEDVFHYEFYFDGESYFADRGSIVYTADVTQRNLLRSANYHNVPILGEKWIDFKGIFSCEANLSGRVYCTDNIVEIYGFTDTLCHVRKFEFLGDRVIVSDYGNMSFSKSERLNNKINSNGYGQIEYESSEKYKKLSNSI